MSSKVKLGIIATLITAIAVMFSGCSFPNIGSGGNSNTNSNTTIGGGGFVLYPDGKRNDDSKQDIGKDGVDISACYENLLGVKVAYDGSAHTVETLQDAKFEATYARISEHLKTNATLDPTEFVKSNAELGVDETYVSRAVWIYNYVNQYRALARLILADISKNYGLGIDNGLVLNNNLYGSVEYDAFTIVENGDYKTNKNAINASVTETTTTLTATNPFVGQGTAVYDNGSVYVDFNTATNISFETATPVPSKAYPFLRNLNDSGVAFVVTMNNPYYDPSNIVNQPTIDDGTGTQIENPQYIAGHILGVSTISFLGSVNTDNSISYEIGTSAISTPTANEFLNQYVDKFANYLALKLLETHTFATTTFDGNPEDVDDIAFFEHYENWLTYQGKLGFDENYFDSNNIEYNTVDMFAEVVEKYIIGENVVVADETAGALSKDIKNTVMQSVFDSITAKMSKNTNNFVFDNDNGETYFQTVYCVEYKDYSTKELFNLKKSDEKSNSASNVRAQNVSASNVGDCDIKIDIGADDILVLPEENYYSVVLMLKQGTEPCIAQGLMTLFWAKNNDINIEMGYRYVLEGKNKIFANVDYSIEPPEVEGEEKVKNEFTGKVEKYDGEQLTMDVANKMSFALEDYNTPKIDTIKNKEITLSKFTNNFVATTATMQNIARIAYSFDATLNYYYYTESSTDCDFVEVTLRASLVESAPETDALPFSLVLMEAILDTASETTE